MNNRKQNKDPKMKIYTGKKVFEPVMMDFIEQLQKAPYALRSENGE